MRTQNRPFRLTAVVAGAGLVFAQLVPWPAVAQVPPSQSPPGAQDQQPAGDPPARVGRLARVNGTVSFHTQDEEQWSPAVANYPVTAGNAFWTEANAQAEIEVSASRIVMGPGTELDIATLDDTSFQATQPQGETYLRLRAAAPGETYAVQTPRGLVSLAAPGRYAVAAGDTQQPTRVTVVEGSAQVTGADLSLQVGPHQTATISGTDALRGDVGPEQRDPFLSAMLDRERPPPQVMSPPVVAAMPGGEDLAEYGAWAEAPEYGQVWYPRVAPDWAPYRDGHWAYVAPWGWTWVDSAPWGFAPFHYGRWVRVGERWGWYPGSPGGGWRSPVYAPALVTFFGVGAGVGIGVGAALVAGRIGWAPLGPREVYRPWYRTSDHYVRQVNVNHVANLSTVNRNVTINNFVNRNAATVVPASALTNSRPVRPMVQQVDPGQLAQARPVFGQQPLRPSLATAGVTPAVARQLNLGAAPPGAVAPRPAAPGPAISASAGTRPFAGQPTVATPGVMRPPPAPGSITPRPGFGAPGTPQATPVLRAPTAPGQVGPPPIQHPQGSGLPATVVRPMPQQPAPGQIGPVGVSRPPPQLANPAPVQPQLRAPATQQPPFNAPGSPQGAPGQIGPAAISRLPPQVTTPATAPLQFRGPATPQATFNAPAAPPGAPGQIGPAAISRPPPQMTNPGAVQPPFRAPSAPAMQQPRVIAPAAPPPAIHTPTPPAPAFRQAPMPQVQAPPPQMRAASPPPPAFHAPPPPAVRAQPAPAAPAAHAPPPPQQQRQKRPGEP